MEIWLFWNQSVGLTPPYMYAYVWMWGILYMCVCVYVFVCLCVSVPTEDTLYTCVYVWVYMYVYTCGRYYICMCVHACRPCLLCCCFLTNGNLCINMKNVFIYPTLPLWKGCDTWSIYNRGTASFNSVFPSPRLVNLTLAKEPSLHLIT